MLVSWLVRSSLLLFYEIGRRGRLFCFKQFVKKDDILYALLLTMPYFSCSTFMPYSGLGREVGREVGHEVEHDAGHALLLR